MEKEKEIMLLGKHVIISFYSYYEGSMENKRKQNSGQIQLLQITTYVVNKLA